MYFEGDPRVPATLAANPALRPNVVRLTPPLRNPATVRCVPSRPQDGVTCTPVTFSCHVLSQFWVRF